MKLTINNLSKTYSNGVKALQNVSLEIPKGMFGFINTKLYFLYKRKRGKSLYKHKRGFALQTQREHLLYKHKGRIYFTCTNVRFTLQTQSGIHFTNAR